MDMGITENLSVTYSTEPAVKKAARGDADSKKESETSAVAEKKVESAVSYEKSDAKETESTKKIYKPDTELVQKLKNEANNRSMQLRNLVEKMLVKQGTAFNHGTDIYELLRTGKVQVDPQTAAQAKEDISEDGYWGVKQTSERLVSFAKALTGGDPSKADEMIEAFKKGYDQATKSWGDTLPSICKQTYDETIKQLNDWKNSLETSTENTEAVEA